MTYVYILRSVEYPERVLTKLGAEVGKRCNNGGNVTQPIVWIICSIIAAAVACWWGPLRFIIYVGPNDVPTGNSIALSVWLGWIWIATFLGSLFFAKWRALWLLILAPFALYLSAMWIFVGHACNLLGRCS